MENQTGVSLIFKTYFLNEKLKFFVNKILFFKKQYFGPQEVEKVLYEYSSSKKNIRINEITKNTKIVFCEGLKEKYLSKIISLKSKYNFKLIIHHGFSHPDELVDKNILNNVDLIIVPSSWVKNLFINEAINLTQKVKFLPMPCLFENINYKKPHGNKKTILLYNKENGFYPKANFSDFIRIIDNYCFENSINLIKFNYGEYKVSEYLNALEDSTIMIYLSNQETQGLALMQAWERNIPTLIYDRGFAKWDNVICPATTSPYYSFEVGEKFNNEENLISNLKNILIKKYTPRNYYYSNFCKELIFKEIDKILANR